MPTPQPVMTQQFYEDTHTSKKHQKSPPSVRVSTLPLSYPSPPLLNKHWNVPLTSTLLVSPPQAFNKQGYSIHPTSPATPEMSKIHQKVTDATTYQNYEAGIAYIPEIPFNQHTSNSLHQPHTVANLSRFNVSPPHNPRPGTSEGMLQNNNKVEHSQVGWIYDQKTRTQNMVSEPKKVLSHQDSVI